MQGMTLFKKRDDNEVFGGWCGFHKTKVEVARYLSDTEALEQEHSGYVVSDDDDIGDMVYVPGIPIQQSGK